MRMANEIIYHALHLPERIDSFLKSVVLPFYCSSLRISSAFGYKLLRIYEKSNFS